MSQSTAYENLIDDLRQLKLSTIRQDLDAHLRLAQSKSLTYLEFLKGHFANSPLKGMVPPMFWAVTVLESIAGVLSGLGALQLLFAGGTALVLWGLVFVMLSLLCLFFGQRLAQDYAGAHVLATYFAVALLGLLLLG